MKIVFVHHYYRNGASSGENTVVDAQIQALKKYGHEVILISEDSKKITSSWFLKLKTGINWATNYGHNPLKKILRISPDLIIVHNLYPGFSSRWIQEVDIPKIYWLHNYRFFCIAASFVYQNQECLLCAKNVSYKSLLRKCADGSISKSFFTFLRLKINHKLPERTSLNHWVSLSPKAKNLFLLTSLDPHRISVIPNFVSQSKSNQYFYSENKWVFAGRLIPEKGIIALAANIPQSIHLDIYGDGPAKEQLESIVRTKPNVHMKGNIDRNSLLAQLPNYSGAFLPSLWVEGIPTTFLEFASAGLPIIGWDVNSTSDFIEKYGCGLTLRGFNQAEIAAAIRKIESNREIYSQNSRRMWESEFSENRWIERVNQLFESVLSLEKPQS